MYLVESFKYASELISRLMIYIKAITDENSSEFADKCCKDMTSCCNILTLIRINHHMQLAVFKWIMLVFTCIITLCAFDPLYNF